MRFLRRPSAARFFIASTQSSVGNGLGYVALLLLAYEIFHSAWAVSAILIADFLPAMFLGPLMGAVVDRLPRRTCIVLADLIGCAAFAALAFASAFWVVIALALLAGVGAALSSTATMAGLPEVFEEDELPKATSLYGIVEEAGVVGGPLLGALLLASGGVATLMLVNAVSFAVSALLIVTVRFRPLATVAAEAPEAAAETSLLRETADGLRALRDMAGARSLILTSTLAVLFFGILNVAELLFAREELGASETTFAALVATMSVGMTVGAVVGAGRADGNRWRRQYLLGLAVMGIAMVCIAGAREIAVVAAALLFCGYGNGLAITHERLLLQHTVAPELHGRVFGIRRTLVAWAFCASYLGAGALAELIGPRGLIALAGGGMLLAFAIGCHGLRGAWVSNRALARGGVAVA